MLLFIFGVHSIASSLSLCTLTVCVSHLQCKYSVLAIYRFVIRTRLSHNGYFVVDDSTKWLLQKRKTWNYPIHKCWALYGLACVKNGRKFLALTATTCIHRLVSLASSNLSIGTVATETCSANWDIIFRMFALSCLWSERKRIKCNASYKIITYSVVICPTWF